MEDENLVSSWIRIFHPSPAQINYIVLILIIFRNQGIRMKDNPYAANEAFGNQDETIMVLLMNNKICMQIRVNKCVCCGYIC